MPYLIADDLPTAPAGERFRALVEAPGIFKLPGAYNGLSSLQAKRAGFDGVYLSGAAMSASMGLPDLGITTIDDVCFLIRQIARAVPLVRMVRLLPFAAPDDVVNTAEFDRLWADMLDGAPETGATLEVLGRKLHLPRAMT